MLGNEQLLAWFQRVRLPECGRSIVRQIRSADPARRVGGGRPNVSGRYPSRKMEITVQFEKYVRQAIEGIIAAGKYPSRKQVLSVITKRNPSLTSICLTSKALQRARLELATAVAMCRTIPI